MHEIALVAPTSRSPGAVVSGSLGARHLVGTAAGAEKARRALRSLRRRGTAAADVARRRLARGGRGSAAGAVEAGRAELAEGGSGALWAVAARGGDAGELVGCAGCADGGAIQSAAFRSRTFQ